MSGMGYAGDVSVEVAWDLLKSEAGSVLVDVRTQAEWAFVGEPDLSQLNKQVVCIEWQSLPTMARNEAFAEQLTNALQRLNATANTSILFLCRSGARSRSAAMLATDLGQLKCFNVEGGFEGDVDQEGHRSSVNGWRYAALPWHQN
jgi:rhodanese-related sulfurtransferase